MYPVLGFSIGKRFVCHWSAIALKVVTGLNASFSDKKGSHCLFRGSLRHLSLQSSDCRLALSLGLAVYIDIHVIACQPFAVAEH